MMAGMDTFRRIITPLTISVAVAGVLISAILYNCLAKRTFPPVSPFGPDHNYTFYVGQHQFGFEDGYVEPNPPPDYFSVVYLGPFSATNSPFTATQGLIAFCCILALVIVLPATFLARWKSKPSAQ
jgi:hypothetical protein